MVKCETHVDFVDGRHARRRLGSGEPLPTRLLKKKCFFEGIIKEEVVA